jgi:hypothetical protein
MDKESAIFVKNEVVPSRSSAVLMSVDGLWLAY